jgi:[acyl-carrier-protein] S-malonyltransferase
MRKHGISGPPALHATAQQEFLSGRDQVEPPYRRFAPKHKPTTGGGNALNSVDLDNDFFPVSYGASRCGAEMSLALVFPGQGSQTVGMGKALAEAFPAARAVFAQVDEALHEQLSRVIWEGPAEALTLTENAQPALMAVSLAAVRVLEAEAGLNIRRDVAFVAGHSLGEYSALTAAGSFETGDAARLLRIRGRAMQRAVPVGSGSMAAVMGLGVPEVAEIAARAAETQVCEIANDNCAGQVVISGHAAAVERAIEIAKERGARRAVMLPVSAPFHCALMQPAGTVMAEALKVVTLRPPAVPLVCNVLARPIREPAEIARRLVDQVSAAVRWRESVSMMAAAGVNVFYELGAGRVLSGLIKRIAESARVVAIGAPADVESAKTERVA